MNKKSKRNYNGSSDYRLYFSKCETTAHKIQTICIVHNATISFIYHCRCCFFSAVISILPLTARHFNISLLFHVLFIACLLDSQKSKFVSIFFVCDDLVAEYEKCFHIRSTSNMLDILWQETMRWSIVKWKTFGRQRKWFANNNNDNKKKTVKWGAFDWI